MEPARIAHLILFLAIAPPATGVGAGEEKAADPPAPQPAEGKYAGDCSRSGCHEDVKVRDFQHGPVAVGQCGACHRPVEGQEHAFESPREESQLCTFPTAERRGTS
jgi:predicted CXXCH cytochrome family protein